jgi:hypothetical protein
VNLHVHIPTNACLSARIRISIRKCPLTRCDLFSFLPKTGVWWKHHPKVHGGYEGCTGEKAYYPCGQDSQGIWEENGDLYAMYPLNWNGEECVETGYTMEDRTFWILWGDPLDKYELNKRTGYVPDSYRRLGDQTVNMDRRSPSLVSTTTTTS